MAVDGRQDAVAWLLTAPVQDATECVVSGAAAFDQLYGQYAGYVYNTCLGILGHPEDARDALQETFVQVYRALPSFRGNSDVATWIYRIAVNKCHDALRKRKRQVAVEDLDALPVAEEAPRDWQMEAQVRAAILRVKPDFRVVLVLHYFQGLAPEEIGRVLHLSANAARVRLHRAREAFRQAYLDGGDGDGQ